MDGEREREKDKETARRMETLDSLLNPGTRYAGRAKTGMNVSFISFYEVTPPFNPLEEFVSSRHGNGPGKRNTLFARRDEGEPYEGRASGTPRPKARVPILSDTSRDRPANDGKQQILLVTIRESTYQSPRVEYLPALIACDSIKTIPTGCTSFRARRNDLRSELEDSRVISDRTVASLFPMTRYYEPDKRKSGAEVDTDNNLRLRPAYSSYRESQDSTGTVLRTNRVSISSGNPRVIRRQWTVGLDWSTQDRLSIRNSRSERIVLAADRPAVPRHATFSLRERHWPFMIHRAWRIESAVGAAVTIKSVRALLT
ncbi:hypothetical protein KM043_003624 [Ampulex compressa]|nr:hypothetical protein KM043_003624 [Ampulex compressa]